VVPCVEFAAVSPSGIDIDRLMHCRRPAARDRSTALSSKRGQCYVVSRRTRLNADRFTVSMTSEQFLFVRDIEQAVAARQLRFFYKYTALFHHKMVAKTKTE